MRSQLEGHYSCGTQKETEALRGHECYPMSHKAGTRAKSDSVHCSLPSISLSKNATVGGSTLKQSKWIFSFNYSFLLHLAIPGPKWGPRFLSTWTGEEKTAAPYLGGREGWEGKVGLDRGRYPRKLLSRWLVNCLTFQVLLNTR